MNSEADRVIAALNEEIGRLEAQVLVQPRMSGTIRSRIVLATVWSEMITTSLKWLVGGCTIVGVAHAIL